MSGTAPYEVNVSGTDDETFGFTIPFENADGTAFPFSDYAIEYSLGSVSVSAPNVTFRADETLEKGEHLHGCRIRHLATGNVFQVFVGMVTIGEGNF